MGNPKIFLELEQDNSQQSPKTVREITERLVSKEKLQLIEITSDLIILY